MKIKNKYLYLAIAIVSLLLVISIYYFAKYSGKNQFQQQPEEAHESQWKVDGNGYLSYPLGREELGFKRETFNQTSNLLISKIIYPSRNGKRTNIII